MGKVVDATLSQQNEKKKQDYSQNTRNEDTSAVTALIPLPPK